MTLGTLDHHRRSGGSDHVRRRMVVVTVAATLALTALACVQLVASQP